MGTRALSGLRAATAFLTRIPVGGSGVDFARGVPWFPFVGGAVGLGVAGVYLAAEQVFPSLLSAVLAVCFGIAVTGALHEDGLGDTFDALGARGSAEDALRILRDPRLGTFGICALAASILIRIAALAALPTRTALLALPAVHALARGSAVQLLAAPLATKDGLGASYAAAITPRRLVLAAAAAMAIALSTLGPWSVGAAAAAVLCALALRSFAVRRIGGVTGDVIGAAEQCSEVGVLLLVVALAQKGWLPAGWWA